jgi:hypothetical protein
MSNSSGQDLQAKFNVSDREQIEGELARMSDESAVVPRMFSRPSSEEHARPAKIMRSLFRCVDRLRTEINTLFSELDATQSQSIPRLTLMYVSPRTFTSMIPMLGSRPHKGTIAVLFELYTLSLIKHSGWDPLAHVPDMTYRVPMGTNSRFGRYKDGRIVDIQLEKWYKPYKMCNGGFDAFIAFGGHSKGKLEELVIGFVQVTCDESLDFNPQHFATAASEISKRIKGFDPPPDKGPLTRSRKNSAVENQAKLRIEIIFAIPTGRSDFTVNKVDVLAPLKNLDKRWKLNKPIIAQVPNSSAFLDNEIFADESLF